MRPLVGGLIAGVVFTSLLSEQFIRTTAVNYVIANKQKVQQAEEEYQVELNAWKEKVAAIQQRRAELGLKNE